MIDCNFSITSHSSRISTRRFTFFILLLSFLVSLPSFAKEVTIGKLKYKVNTTDKIAKCTGLAEEATQNYNLVIPSTVVYEGVTLKVTTVEKDAFWFDNYLKKVTLSDYTETIGSNAFASCDNLSIVSLGKKLKIIGAEAFAHCGNRGTFTTIELPNTVEIIRDKAFLDCRSLVSVTMGDKVQTIGNHAFWNCEALKSIILPGSLTSIGESAFACCDELSEVSFKQGTGNTVIGEKCFDNLKKLKMVNFFGPGVADIGDSAFIGCSIEWLSIPSSVHTIRGGAFCGNNISMLELPEGLKVIGELAFEGQYGVGLRAFDIPSTVTSIGQKAFYQVGNLETIQCKALTPPTLGEDAFDFHAHNYGDLWVNPASLQNYINAPGWKEFKFINNVETAITEIDQQPEEETEEWFDLNGRTIEMGTAVPGIYIIKKNNQTEKRIIR